MSLPRRAVRRPRVLLGTCLAALALSGVTVSPASAHPAGADLLTGVRTAGSSLALSAADAASVGSLGSAGSASVAVSNSAAARYGAGYLARQITANGGYLAPFGTPDLGNTAYAVVALTAAGVGRDASTQAIAYLKRQVATGLTDSSGQDSAGALANVILAAVAAGENPRAFGGQKPAHNLVSRLLGTVRTSGANRGLFGASDPTYDGAFRQGLALTALDGAGVGKTQVTSAIGWLTSQQCSNGLWTSYRANVSVPCPAADPATFAGPDTNSTSLAVQGLAAYGSTPRRAATLSSLDAAQSADGGFPFLVAPGQPSDPNSTALTIQAIVAERAAPAAARWVKNGVSPYAALAAYQLGCADPAQDRGAYYFPGDRSANVLATIQAVPAQVGETLPVAHRDHRPAVPTVPCGA